VCSGTKDDSPDASISEVKDLWPKNIKAGCGAVGLYVHAQLDCNIAGNDVELHVGGFVDPALERETCHVNNVDNEER
jgi:hypothetical protein